MPTNDNDSQAPGILAHASDAHGQAALVLVESLIHGLVERAVLTTADAVAIIDVAKDVQADLAEEADGAGARIRESHTLLTAMSDSLKGDLAYPDGSPR